MTISTAQRAAAATLPFDLSDAEIARQFNEDGTTATFVSRFHPQRARQLARDAMNAIATLPIAA